MVVVFKDGSLVVMGADSAGVGCIHCGGADSAGVLIICGFDGEGCRFCGGNLSISSGGADSAGVSARALTY